MYARWDYIFSEIEFDRRFAGCRLKIITLRNSKNALKFSELMKGNILLCSNCTLDIVHLDLNCVSYNLKLYFLSFWALHYYANHDTITDFKRIISSLCTERFIFFKILTFSACSWKKDIVLWYKTYFIC